MISALQRKWNMQHESVMVLYCLWTNADAVCVCAIRQCMDLLTTVNYVYSVPWFKQAWHLTNIEWEADRLRHRRPIYFTASKETIIHRQRQPGQPLGIMNVGGRGLNWAINVAHVNTGPAQHRDTHLSLSLSFDRHLHHWDSRIIFYELIASFSKICRL